MFKILLPNKKLDVSWVTILYGHDCGDAIDCPYSNKCRYGKQSYKWHNFNAAIRRWLEYKLHIELPIFPIQFLKKWDKLSGTEKCPFHLPRNYTCFDCKYHYLDDELEGHCNCKQHLEERKQGKKDTYHNDIWSDFSCCNHFEPYSTMK